MTPTAQAILREVLGAETLIRMDQATRSKHPEVMDNPPTIAMVQATLIRTDQVQVPPEVKAAAWGEEATHMVQETLATLQEAMEETMILMAPARLKARAAMARLVIARLGSCWRKQAACSRTTISPRRDKPSVLRPEMMITLVETLAVIAMEVETLALIIMEAETLAVIIMEVETLAMTTMEVETLAVIAMEAETTTTTITTTRWKHLRTTVRCDGFLLDGIGRAWKLYYHNATR